MLHLKILVVVLRTSFLWGCQTKNETGELE